MNRQKDVLQFFIIFASFSPWMKDSQTGKRSENRKWERVGGEGGGGVCKKSVSFMEWLRQPLNSWELHAHWSSITWMERRDGSVKHLEEAATNKTAGSEQLAHKVNWTQERIISEINISLQVKEEVGLSGPSNIHKHNNQHKALSWGDGKWAIRHSLLRRKELRSGNLPLPSGQKRFSISAMTQRQEVAGGGRIACSTGFPGLDWRNASSLPWCSSCPLSPPTS